MHKHVVSSHARSHPTQVCECAAVCVAPGALKAQSTSNSGIVRSLLQCFHTGVYVLYTVVVRGYIIVMGLGTVNLVPMRC